MTMGWTTKVRIQKCADFLVLSPRSDLGNCEIAGFSSGVGVNETCPLLECHTALIPINAVWHPRRANSSS